MYFPASPGVCQVPPVKKFTSLFFFLNPRVIGSKIANVDRQQIQYHMYKSSNYPVNHFGSELLKNVPDRATKEQLYLVKPSSCCVVAHVCSAACPALDT